MLIGGQLGKGKMGECVLDRIGGRGWRCRRGLWELGRGHNQISDWVINGGQQPKPPHCAVDSRQGRSQCLQSTKHDCNILCDMVFDTAWYKALSLHITGRIDLPEWCSSESKSMKRVKYYITRWSKMDSQPSSLLHLSHQKASNKILCICKGIRDRKSVV